MASKKTQRRKLLRKKKKLTFTLDKDDFGNCPVPGNEGSVSKDVVHKKSGRTVRRRMLRKKSKDSKIIDPKRLSRLCAYPEKSGGYGHFFTARLSVTQTIQIDVAVKSAKQYSTLRHLEREGLVYRSLKCSEHVPVCYGLVKNHPQITFGTALVTELLPIPLKSLWRGRSRSSPIDTVDCFQSPTKAGPLLEFTLSSFATALPVFHATGTTHGDLKPSNILYRILPGTKLPVNSYVHLEQCLIDWGLSMGSEDFITNTDTDGHWKSGTVPCSMGSAFERFPGRAVGHDRCMAADYFQALMSVVVLMAIGGDVVYKSHQFRSGWKQLGLRWLHIKVTLCQRSEQSHRNRLTGWIGFLMFHESDLCCDIEGFHDVFCCSVRRYLKLYDNYIMQYDLDFSKRIMSINPGEGGQA